MMPIADAAAWKRLEARLKLLEQEQKGHRPDEVLWPAPDCGR